MRAENDLKKPNLKVLLGVPRSLLARFSVPVLLEYPIHMDKKRHGQQHWNGGYQALIITGDAILKAWLCGNKKLIIVKILVELL